MNQKSLDKGEGCFLKLLEKEIKVNKKSVRISKSEWLFIETVMNKIKILPNL